MIPELINESLHWCTRYELDRMKMVSRKFHRLIVDRSAALPRRTLERVDVGYGRIDKIQLKRSSLVSRRPDEVLRPAIYETLLHNHIAFEGILRRLKHTVIVELRFRVADSAFWRHFVAHAQDADVVVERIKFRMPVDPKPEDYAFRDAVVALLRPLSVETDEVIEGLRRRYNN